MRKLIFKCARLLSVVGGLLYAGGAACRQTNAYRDLEREEGTGTFPSMPESIGGAVFGTSHGREDFKSPPEGEGLFDPSLALQTPVYDLRLMREYQYRIRPGALGVIAVSPMPPFLRAAGRPARRAAAPVLPDPVAVEHRGRGPGAVSPGALLAREYGAVHLDDSRDPEFAGRCDPDRDMSYMDLEGAEGSDSLSRCPGLSKTSRTRMVKNERGPGRAPLVTRSLPPSVGELGSAVHEIQHPLALLLVFDDGGTVVVHRGPGVDVAGDELRRDLR